MTTIVTTYRNRRRAAQVGLIARGVLYLIVGILALQIAFGGGGGQANQQGALQTIAQGPFGTVLVALVGLGLAGYAGWRVSQFFTENGDEDNRAKAWATRVGFLVRALVYAGLSFLALSIAFGESSGGGGSQAMTARVMALPGGRVIVGLAGLIIVGVAGHQAYQAYSDDFMEELQTQQMNLRTRTWVRRIGVLGHAGRAVVFSVVGWFVVVAAVQFDPRQAVGLDGALQRLAQHTAGPWLLALTAVGLFAYGVYAIVRARYVDVSE